MKRITCSAGPPFQNYALELPAYYSAQREAYMQPVRVASSVHASYHKCAPLDHETKLKRVNPCAGFQGLVPLEPESPRQRCMELRRRVGTRLASDGSGTAAAAA